MFSRIISSVLACLLSLAVFGQASDSLYVLNKNSKAFIDYHVKLGETIFMLAKRFHCPPAMLADANGLTYRNTIKDSTSFSIPLGDYNYLREKPEKLRLSQIRRLFYKVPAGQNDLFSISRNTGVSKDNLQQWNRLYDNMIQAGDVMLVGWVVYDETQVPDYKPPPVQVIYEDKTKSKPVAGKPVVTPDAKQTVPDDKKSKIAVMDEDRKNGTKPKGTQTSKVQELIVPIMDTSKYKTSETETAYMKQTHNEAKITLEKGPAVFFDLAGGHGGNVFYGFHNTVPRGTIIKVYNPGTSRAIYVKILGPLPETKQYYNTIMGINSDAKEALGVKETRLWCELSFAEN